MFAKSVISLSLTMSVCYTYNMWEGSLGALQCGESSLKYLRSIESKQEDSLDVSKIIKIEKSYVLNDTTECYIAIVANGVYTAFYDFKKQQKCCMRDIKLNGEAFEYFVNPDNYDILKLYYINTQKN